MQDYAATFTNYSGSFPSILAINATSPTAQDGTEFVANMINDSMWGVWQMMLNHAGLTPNGVVESSSASQIRDAMWKGFGAPPGVVTQWHLASDPGTTGHRALLLNGQGIVRANYSYLDVACYVGDANNAAVAAAGGKYYHADNADGSSPNTAGVYLILPDFRGVVPRGLDTGAIHDPGGASRYLGDEQADAFQGHKFLTSLVYLGPDNPTYGDADPTTTYGGTPSTMSTRFPGYTSNPVTDGVNGTPRTSSETRMYNVSTKFVVWY